VAESDPGRDPLRSRRRTITLALVAALAVVGAALTAASKIESPQQAAAKALPPTPSVITATVQRTVLSETVDAQGQVSAGQTVNVSGAGAAPPGDEPVVTAMPLHAGEEVYSGQLLVEVSGEPVIALPGRLPAYRDLMPGDSGPDVVQLQQALADLGYSITDTTGWFGTSTEAAIAAMYARLGYSVPTTQPTASSSPQSSSSSPPSNSPQADSGSANGAAKSVVYLPQGQVQYVPSLPARVASIHAGVGSSAAGTVLTLAEGGLQVTGSLDPVNGPVVKPGMAAFLSLQGSTDQSLAAKVTWVGALSVNSSTGASYPVTLSGVDPLPESWAGQQVTVSIAVHATSGPVLAVPASAVYSTASGATHVLLFTGGRETTMPVTVGISVGGLVQVSGALTPGERVVLGVSGQ
jgi:peptidoglycan hydrolase-like protein with peptidoglycan-binding domain